MKMPTKKEINNFIDFIKNGARAHDYKQYKKDREDLAKKMKNAPTPAQFKKAVSVLETLAKRDVSSKPMTAQEKVRMMMKDAEQKKKTDAYYKNAKTPNILLLVTDTTKKGAGKQYVEDVPLTPNNMKLLVQIKKELPSTKYRETTPDEKVKTFKSLSKDSAIYYNKQILKKLMFTEKEVKKIEKEKPKISLTMLQTLFLKKKK